MRIWTTEVPKVYHPVVKGYSNLMVLVRSLSRSGGSLIIRIPKKSMDKTRFRPGDKLEIKLLPWKIDIDKVGMNYDDLIDAAKDMGWEITHARPREDGWDATLRAGDVTITASVREKRNTPDVIVRITIPLAKPSDVENVLEKAKLVGANVIFQDKELKLVLEREEASKRAEELLERGERISAVLSVALNSHKDSVADVMEAVSNLRSIKDLIIYPSLSRIYATLSKEVNMRVEVSEDAEDVLMYLMLTFTDLLSRELAREVKARKSKRRIVLTSEDIKRAVRPIFSEDILSILIHNDPPQHSE